MGLPFTWSNRRYNGPMIWARLDRAMVSTDWMFKFPTARLHHLLGSSSDHNLIWLCTDDAQNRFYRPNKPFMFESMWLNDERCKGVVHSAWDIGLTSGPMENVLLKVSNCQSFLCTWNKKVFGNVRILLAQKRKQLVKAEASFMVGGDHDKVKSLSEEIENLMKLEECMWNQRAKSDWLKYGDQNTKYFHCRSLERNERNFIAGLKNEVGDWIENEGKVGDMIVNYFSSLFTSSNPLSLDPVLSGVEPRVSLTMNEDLDGPFKASEVRVAIQ